LSAHHQIEHAAGVFGIARSRALLHVQHCIGKQIGECVLDPLRCGIALQGKDEQLERIVSGRGEQSLFAQRCLSDFNASRAFDERGNRRWRGR
jgi:hypothetical protein